MPGTWLFDSSTNVVSVTGGTEGSPASRADFYIAEIGNTRELKGATAGANGITLSTQIKPCEELALKIDFVVASKTIETDYIHIEGTNKNDDIIGESIDVSLGNGTYRTQQHYKTITDIDCNDSPINSGGTVWADGTVQVIQNRWGVLHHFGNNIYQQDCRLDIGNSGGTSTYFAEDAELLLLTVSVGNMSIKTDYANATYRSGTLISAVDKSINNGCKYVDLSSNSDNYIIYNLAGNLLLYGGEAKSGSVSTTNIRPGNANDKLYHVEIKNLCGLASLNVATTIYACKMMTGRKLLGFRGNIDNFYISGLSTPMQFRYDAKIKSLLIVGNTYLADCYNPFNATVHLINCSSASWDIVWYAGTGSIYRQLILAIEVQDELGNAISGAACTLTDVASGVVWNAELTDASGNIAATGEDGSGETNSISYKRYYYSGGAQTTTYGPWTLTVSKAGYKTETVFIGTDEAELWEANLGGKIPVTLSRAGIPPYFTEYAND